jgi:oxazoline/thiazoline synthase
VPDQPYFRLSPCYVVTIAQNSVVFCGEDQNHLFQGEEYARIVQRLAGNRFPDSESRVVNEQSNGLADELTGNAMYELAKAAVLTSASSPDTPRTAYWESIGYGPKTAEIAVESLAPGCSDLLKHALLSVGIEIGSADELLVIATDDYLRPEVMVHADRSRPSLIAKPVGHTIWLGPLIIPGRTICFGCLSSALQRNRWLQEAAGLEQRLGYLPQPSIASLPGTIAIATGMISTVAAVYLATGSYPSLENTIVSLDTRTMSCTYNAIQRDLDCPECGRLGACKDEGIEELHKFLSPLTGIVSSVQITESPQVGLFHASGAFLHPRCPSKKRPPLHLGRSSGKGFSSHDAQVSCIAEAIERYSITYQGTELECKPDSNHDEVIAPNDVLLFSANQFRHRAEWNRSHSELQWVPEPTRTLTEITWTRADSLVSDRSMLVPAGLVYMYFPFKNEPEYCNADTNGCAAGRSLAEAKLNALLELIERDAVAIWWYNRIRRPAIDLGMFGDSSILKIQRAFERQGHSAYVLDVTTDLGIPAYVAVAPAQDGSAPYFGCAAHVSPRIAALKALAEASQIWFWSQQGGNSNELSEWLSQSNTRENRYLEPDGVRPPPFQAGICIEDSLDLCATRVFQAGIEPFYVDLTRPETGVPVVRVLAPGLRHFWARFAPGRLYDVPLAMGWLPRKLEEEDLNPIPCMI